MTDTNGRVDPSHLVAFGSVQISRAIHQKTVTTSNDFHRSGYSFDIQPPGGGDRPWDMQGAMQADYDARKYQQPPYYLSPPPSPRPGNPGTSRHGFGLAIDVITNAPVAVRNAIMARNGWHLWSASDPNHFEPNEFNVLVSPPETALASDGSTPLDDDPEEVFDNMTSYELARQSNDPAVWYCVDRMHRWHVRDQAQLNDVVFFITAQQGAGNKAANPTVQVVGDITSFGVIVQDAASAVSPASGGGTVDAAGLATKADISDLSTAIGTDIAAVAADVKAIKIPTTFVAQ